MTLAAPMFGRSRTPLLAETVGPRRDETMNALSRRLETRLEPRPPQESRAARACASWYCWLDRMNSSGRMQPRFTPR